MDKINKTLNLIKQLYPNPTCELWFKDDYQCVVAVILSAQCADKRVNMVTPSLFSRYPNFESLSKADEEELQGIIHSCGFYHNKSKNLINMAKDVTANYGGKLPMDKAKLTSLAGVGEKTANVVLASYFKQPAIAVDTHVFRVANRLGLADAKNVLATQKQLEKNVPKDYWIDLHYSLVLHGRYVCKAINPNCSDCKLKTCCKYYLANKK